MAKTRDEKFKLVFDSFVKDTLGFENYVLENRTKNKTESHHIYTFVLYNPYILIEFTDDEYYFRQKFTNIFRPHELSTTYISDNNENDFYVHRLSYVDIVEYKMNENNGNIEGKICVKYHKLHIPYKVIEDPTFFEQKYLHLLKSYDHIYTLNDHLTNNIDELKDELDETLNEIRNLNKRFIWRQKKYKLYEKNLQNKLRDFYSQLSDKEDCPVCYEKLETEHLVIPHCAHFICDSCSHRCDTCPICREKYVN